MAKTVSVMGVRGGAGKTALTVGLAHEFACGDSWGKRVLVVDLDPQANVSRSVLGTERYDREVVHGLAPVVRDLFVSAVDALKAPTFLSTRLEGRPGARLDLLPSRPDHGTAFEPTAERIGQLERQVAAISDQYDLVLVDSPSTGTGLMAAAILASDLILVPVTSDETATLDLPFLAARIAETREHRESGGTPVIRVVFNHPTRTRGGSEAAVRATAARLGWPVLHHQLGYSARLHGTTDGEVVPVGSGDEASRSWPGIVEVAVELATELVV